MCAEPVAVGARGDGMESVQVRGVGMAGIGVKRRVHGPGPARWWRWKRGGVPRRVGPLVRWAACVECAGGACGSVSSSYLKDQLSSAAELCHSVLHRGPRLCPFFPLPPRLSLPSTC